MFNSNIIDVTIALAVVYLVLSLVCSTITETWTSAWNSRGRNLRDGVKHLLGNSESLVQKFSYHKLVCCLFKDQSWLSRLADWLRKISERCTTPLKRISWLAWLGNFLSWLTNGICRFLVWLRLRYPSYIKSETFAQAVLEIVGGTDTRLSSAVRRKMESFPEEAPNDEEKAAYQGLSQVLVGFYDECRGDLDCLKKRTAEWFDDTMDRVSGWYQRRFRVRLAVVAISVAFLTNADTLAIFRTLNTDEAARKSLVALAPNGDANADATPADENGGAPGAVPGGQPVADAADTPAPDGGDAEDAVGVGREGASNKQELSRDDLLAVAPLLGWPEGGLWDNLRLSFQFRKLIGLLLTAVALSLGAPFWFDMLNKLVKVRASVRAATGESQAGAAASAAGDAEAAVQGAAPAGAVGALATATTADAFTTGMIGFTPFSAQHNASNAYWLAQLAKNAYLKHPSEPDGTNEFAETVKQWGLQSRFFQNKGTDTQGYVVFDSDLLIIAFRGTEKTIKDFATDATFTLTPWLVKSTAGSPPGTDTDFAPSDTGLQVHSGFNSAIDAIWPEMIKTVMEVRTENQAIWFTGHSLGGALAMLGADKLSREGLPEKEPAALSQANKQRYKQITVSGVYTYGQPRVGDETFADAYDVKRRDRTFRHVNNRDVVPRVPIRAMGFRHAGTVIYFDSFGKLHTDPGFWLRFLDTVPIDVDKIKDAATETFADHSMEGYVELLSNQLPPGSPFRGVVEA